MQVNSFHQLLNFRPKCLCGWPLTLTFKARSFDDDYLRLQVTNSGIKELDGAQYRFGYSFESRTQPYGHVNFSLIVNAISGACICESSSHNFRRDLNIRTRDFVKQHFSYSVQHRSDLIARVYCTNMIHCKHRYSLETSPIIFNFYNNRMCPIQIASEFFYVDKGNFEYKFATYFQSHATTISSWRYSDPTSNFSNPTNSSYLEINSQKFLQFPWDTELLINKARTLITFS